MRKCIHGKVKPCWICKHDYDRAAPYVATNWQQEAEEWKAECHRVSGELEADKSKMIDRSYADDLLAENIRLEAENARLTLLITNHNAECESLCDPERCGYAPYKRQCPTCPKDWIIGESTSAGGK